MRGGENGLGRKAEREKDAERKEKERGRWRGEEIGREREGRV